MGYTFSWNSVFVINDLIPSQSLHPSPSYCHWLTGRKTPVFLLTYSLHPLFLFRFLCVSYSLFSSPAPHLPRSPSSSTIIIVFIVVVVAAATLIFATS